MTIHEAAAQGDVTAVQRMLAAGTTVDTPNDYGQTPLMEAASQGRAEVVRLLLESGANPRLLNSLALDFAVRLGNAECVRLLLYAGADPNRDEPVEDDPDDPNAPPLTGEDESGDEFDEDDPDDSSDPPLLYEAIRRRNMEMVQLLLDAGARVDVVCAGYGLLAVAVQHSDGALFDLLREKKASVAGSLRAVAQSGNTQYLDRLLALGADIEDAGRDGSTALSWAAYCGRTAMIRKLLALGADKESRDDCGKTPLGHAVQENQLEAARTLLAAGANLDGNEHEPLLTRAICNQRLRMVRLLLEHGADPNETRGDQPAPLFVAVDVKKSRIVQLLLEFKADPNARLAKRQRYDFASKLTPGTTPLMLAARKRSARIVKLLLDAGADPKLLDDKGRSAVDRAARAGDPALTQLLIDAGSPITIDPKARHNAALLRTVRHKDTAGALAALSACADPNAADKSGKTALIWSAQHGLIEVVQTLLSAGADPNRVSKYGEAALRHAALRQNAQVVRLLIAGGADINHRYEPGSIPIDQRGVYCSFDTALHDAATYGTLEVMSLLIEAGADINAIGAGDLTPLVAAVNCRRMDSADLLLKAGAEIRSQDELWLAPYRFARAAENPAYRAFVDQVVATSGQPAQPVDRLPGVFSFRITLDPQPEEPPPSDPVEAGRRWGENFSREWAELDQKAGAILRELSERARQAGFLLFDAGKPIGCGPMTQFVVLLPTSDKYEAMVAFGVHANDQEMNTAEIIRRFRELDAEEPFDLRGVTFDSVDIEFRRLVKDPDGLARRLHEFCHDLADDWAKIAEWLRTGRRIKFWWD